MEVGVLNIKSRGGRKPEMVMVEGELVQVKKLSRFGNSLALFLPKPWLTALSYKHGKDVTAVTLDFNIEVLTIRPYFGDEEGGS